LLVALQLWQMAGKGRLYCTTTKYICSMVLSSDKNTVLFAKVAASKDKEDEEIG
jgi:hypothetical protein